MMKDPGSLGKGCVEKIIPHPPLSEIPPPLPCLKGLEMKRKLLYLSPVILALGLACSSPSTQESSVAIVPSPYVDITQPIDHVFKALLSDRAIAVQVAQHSDAVEKDADGEIWLLKGQGGIIAFRLHLIPTGPTTTRLEMGNYAHPQKSATGFIFVPNRVSNTSQPMADIVTAKYLSPLQAWFKGGEHGPIPECKLVL